MLAFLVNVLGSTEGRKKCLTRREAQWVIRVGWALPDEPSLTWILARDYMLREDNNQGTEDLDAFIAFFPYLAGDDKQDRENLKRLFLELFPRTPSFYKQFVRELVESRRG